MKIVAEPGVPQVVVSREFAAPPKALLRAHTEPDLLERWYGPDFLTTTAEVLEPRDGGRWRWTQTDRTGERFTFFGLYHGTPSTERIVQTWEFDRQPGVVYLNTITFEERGTHTLLTQNTVFPSVEDRDVYVRGGMDVGLRASFAKLDALVTGRS
jgi:uncharacterized protein YndB with AHSA1/START domain